MSAYKWVHNTAQYENGLSLKISFSTLSTCCGIGLVRNLLAILRSSHFAKKVQNRNCVYLQVWDMSQLHGCAFFLAWSVRPGTMGAGGSY